METQQTIEEIRGQAEKILHRGRLTNGNLHHIKVLFSKFYKIQIRGEERTFLNEHINSAVVNSIEDSVVFAKLNRKNTSKKLRIKLQEARNGN